MYRNSVSEIVEEQYGISIAPGQKGECPFCGKAKTFSIKSDNTIGKCFHPDCEKYITPSSKDSGVDHLQQFIHRVCMDFHARLLMSQDIQPVKTAYDYLLSRGIHPKVISHSMIGVIPLNYNILTRV